MWFPSFTTPSPPERRPTLLDSVIREIHINLTEARLKLQQLIHFSSSTVHSTADDDNNRTAPDTTTDNAPEDRIPATPSSLYSLSFSERYLPSIHPSPPPSACYSQCTLPCYDEAPNYSTDALLLPPEALRDPFHVRSNITPTESDDLDSLRYSSARVAFSDPHVGPINDLTSVASHSAASDGGSRSSSLTFLASLISWRSGDNKIQRKHSNSSLTSRPTTSGPPNPSSVNSPLSSTPPFLSVPRARHPTAFRGPGAQLDAVPSPGQTVPPLILMPPLIDDHSPHQLSLSQSRFNSSYGPTCVAVMQCL